MLSLGAVAFHIFSGRPPAASATELNQILTEHKGLSLGAALDGAASGLQKLVREATAPDLLLRTESARDFLDTISTLRKTNSPRLLKRSSLIHSKRNLVSKFLMTSRC